MCQLDVVDCNYTEGEFLVHKGSKLWPKVLCGRNGNCEAALDGKHSVLKKGLSRWLHKWWCELQDWYCDVPPSPESSFLNHSCMVRGVLADWLALGLVSYSSSDCWDLPVAGHLSFSDVLTACTLWSRSRDWSIPKITLLWASYFCFNQITSCVRVHLVAQMQFFWYN